MYVNILYILYINDIPISNLIKVLSTCSWFPRYPALFRSRLHATRYWSRYEAWSVVISCAPKNKRGCPVYMSLWLSLELPAYHLTAPC